MAFRAGLRASVGAPLAVFPAAVLFVVAALATRTDTLLKSSAAIIATALLLADRLSKSDFLVMSIHPVFRRTVRHRL